MCGLQKILLKNEKWLSTLNRISREEGTRKNLRISHMDRHVCYGSVEEDVILTAEAAYIFIMILKNTSLFHSASFYKAANLVIKDLRELYRRHISVDHACFKWFMAARLQATQDLSSSVKGTVSEQHVLFDYDQPEKTKREEEWAAV